MNRLARFRRALVVGLVAAAATLSMTQVANAEQAAKAEPRRRSPVAIAVPAGNKVFLVGHAKGVQIYTCNGTARMGTGHPRREVVRRQGKARC